MFEKTSTKIKVTAKIFFILFSLISIIVGVIFLTKYFDSPSELRKMADGYLFGGLALIFLAPILFWTISIALYGEAVIIDNTSGTPNTVDAYQESRKYEMETYLKMAKVKRLKRYLLQNLITEEEYNNEINKLKDL